MYLNIGANQKLIDFLGGNSRKISNSKTKPRFFKRGFVLAGPTGFEPAIFTVTV